MDDQQNSQQQNTPEITEWEPQPEETIHIHYFPDAIVILKEEDQTQVVDSAPVPTPKTSMIPAYDINQACCATSVLAKNTQPFTGGQNERDFSTVSR